MLVAAGHLAPARTLSSTSRASAAGERSEVVADAEPDSVKIRSEQRFSRACLRDSTAPEPDLHGLELLLDHEGVRLDGAAGAGPAQEVLEPLEHLRAGPGGDDLSRHP